MFDRNSIPRTPSGSDSEALRFINTHETLHPARRPMPTKPTQQFRGISGWHWKTPAKNLNAATDSVKKDEVVQISTTNLLVTVGYTDLDGGSATCTAGTWVALTDIPPVSAGSYNVPQDPPPEDDLDAIGGDGKPVVKWLLIKSIC